MKTSLKILILIFGLQVSHALHASSDIDLLLEQVQSRIESGQQSEDLRLERFRKHQLQRAQLLSQARAELAAAKLKQQQLMQQFDLAKSQLDDLSGKLLQRSSDLQSLFKLARKYATDLSATLASSLTNGQYPNRQEQLDFASDSKVPQLRDLQNLWFLLLQEMAANAQNKRFSSTVVDSQGQLQESKVIRLGALAAFDERGQYLSFNLQSERLQALPGQSEELASRARQFFNGQRNSVAIDHQKGELLLQLGQIPNLEQRIHQGGTVGYIILTLGAAGLLIGLWRTLYMGWLSSLVKRQLKSSRASDNNPLGRVLLAASGARKMQRAELLIDESLLKELAILQRGHSTVKLLAAVAPLLGLLGTVTGMIETFQSITLVGASDPKLMAGGISQALITTVMGLCVAIPLLFVHSYISTQSKAIVQRIQQQSLLLLSQYFSEPSSVETFDGLSSEVASPTEPHADRGVIYGGSAVA